jgi:LysR family transcriptional activator of nhaA
MQASLKDRRLPNRTPVRIGSLDTIPKHMSLELTTAALKVGNCAVSVIEGGPDFLLEELFANRLDLLLSNSPPSLLGAHGSKERVFARSIAKMGVSVFGNEAYRSLQKGFPHSLNGKPMVLPTLDCRLRQEVMDFFKLRDLAVELVAETQDTALQKLLGVNGVGLVVLPEIAAEELVAEKKLFSLGRLEGVTEEIWLVAARRKIENPVASRLMRNFVLA